LTHSERKSGYLLTDKLERATAELTEEKTIESFSKIPRGKGILSPITMDPNFQIMKIIGREIKINIYFVYPYHS
jgi:IS30 family transposase